MSYPVYTVYSGDVLPIFFDTFDGGTGASITMTGLAVTDIEIYKDGGTTQRASDAGYTLLDTDGIDFDGITGIHGFSIDTGDNTGAGFYAVGSWYHVVVSSVTIDGQTVNFIAAAFRIVAAESDAGIPIVQLSAASIDAIMDEVVTSGHTEAGSLGKLVGDNLNAPVGTVDTVVDAIKDKTDNLPADPADDSDIDSQLATIAGYLDTEIAAILAVVDTEVAAIKAKTDSLTFTVAGMVDANVVDWKGATAPAMTGDAYARLGAPAGASIAADLVAIDNFVDDLESRITATRAGYLDVLADLLEAGRLDLLIDAIKAKTDSLTFTVAGVLDSNVTYWKGSASPAMTGDAYARLGAPTGASVSADVASLDALIDILTAYVDTEVAAIKLKTDNLPANPAATGDIPTAGANADAVWDEAIADHAGVGTFGAKNQKVVPSETLLDYMADVSALALTADLAIVDGLIDAIKATIDSYLDVAVSSRLASASYVAPANTNIAAIKAKTDNLPANPAAVGSAMTLDVAYDAAKSAASQASVDAVDVLVDAVDLVVDAIKAKTDNLPASPAAVGSAMTLTPAYDSAKSAASQASVDAVDDYVDAEMAAVKAVTDKLDTAMELDGVVYKFTTNALENAPTGDGGFTSDDRTKLEAIDTELADGGRTDLLIDGIKAKTDLIPASPAAVGSAMALTPAYDAAKTAAAQASVDVVDTVVDAIKAKTDNLPASPAAVGSAMALNSTYDAAKTAASQASVNNLTAYVDTEVADIKAKTDLIPASPAAVGSAMTLSPAYDAAKTAATQSSVDTIDLVSDAIKAKTDNLPASPAATGAAMTLTGDYDAAKTAASQASVDALPTAAENAEYLLKLDLSTLSGEAAKSVLNAVRYWRNKKEIVAGVLYVYKENGTSVAWSANITSDASSEPVIKMEPTT